MIMTDRRLTVTYVAECVSYHMAQHITLYVWHSGLQQGVCSMGTTNVNARKQAGPSDNFTRQSVSIEHRSGQVSPQVCNYGRDLGPYIHTYIRKFITCNIVKHVARIRGAGSRKVADVKKFFDPETKLQSKQWKHATFPLLVKFRKLPLLAK